jgi:hypothetical protein
MISTMPFTFKLRELRTKVFIKTQGISSLVRWFLFLEKSAYLKPYDH